MRRRSNGLFAKSQLELCRISWKKNHLTSLMRGPGSRRRAGSAKLIRQKIHSCARSLCLIGLAIIRALYSLKVPALNALIYSGDEKAFQGGKKMSRGIGANIGNFCAIIEHLRGLLWSGRSLIRWYTNSYVGGSGGFGLRKVAFSDIFNWELARKNVISHFESLCKNN